MLRVGDDRVTQYGRRWERISDEHIELALDDVETQHGTEDAAAEKAATVVKIEGSPTRQSRSSAGTPAARSERHPT